MLVSDVLKAHVRNIENQVPFKDYCKTENFLGKGGYGEVYRGKFDNNRDIAIKQMEIKKEKYQNAEVELHFSLRHENILNCLGVEKDVSYRYYISDLAAGTMIDLFTSDQKRTELGQRVQSALTELQVLHQMASGLAYLHSEGIVHGDIKPENILISLNDPVLIKLADFGLCKEVTFPGRNIFQPDPKCDLSSCIGSFTLTTIRGTPGWTSPEAIKMSQFNSASLKKFKAAGNSKRGSTASDVFAYGLVSFYYINKGIHPFGPYPWDEHELSIIIIPNIFKNKPINFEKIDLPIHHPTRILILETIEHEEKKRLTAHEVLSKLDVLKSDGRNTTIDTSTFEKLIKNRERWDFAEVWEIKTPSTEASASTSFSNRVINKHQMKILPPALSFLDAIQRTLFFPLKEELIEELRYTMDKAVDTHLIDTVPTIPLILFGYDESINVPKAIGLVVPISDLTLLNIPLEQHESNRPESTFCCVFCIRYTSENLLAVTRLFGDGWSFLGFMKEDPIEVAFRYYQGFNLIELVGHLIENDVNMKLNSGGWNALHLACRFYKGNQMIDIVTFLINSGIDLKARVHGMHNANALHTLCFFYSGVHFKEIIELLVKNGINPIEKATEGWNVLHLVCRHYTGPNMREIIQLLISYGINVNEKLERKSMNALHFLCQHYTGTDLIEIIDLFIQNGIDVKATDDEGWNGLHFVCAFYYKFATNLKDIIDLFIRNGIDPCAKDYRGWQVLHILCRFYNREDLKDIIVSLVKRKVDLNALTFEFTSAFYFLCRNYTRSNLKEIVHLFYDNGFRMERVEFEWAALVQVCFVNRGPSEELFEIVRRITEEIMQRDKMNAKTYIDQALEMLKEFNLDLDRKEIIDYLKLVSEEA